MCPRVLLATHDLCPLSHVPCHPILGHPCPPRCPKAGICRLLDLLAPALLSQPSPAWKSTPKPRLQCPCTQRWIRETGNAVICEHPVLALLIPPPNLSCLLRCPEGPRLFHKSGCKQVICCCSGFPLGPAGSSATCQSQQPENAPSAAGAGKGPCLIFSIK